MMQFTVLSVDCNRMMQCAKRQLVELQDIMLQRLQNVDKPRQHLESSSPGLSLFSKHRLEHRSCKEMWWEYG